MEPNIEPAPPNRGESSLASVPVQPEPVLLPENKSFNPLILILAFLLVFFLGAGGMYAWQNWSEINPFKPREVGCTMDAKICPDGSAVGRTGPNCEFVPCPSMKASCQDDSNCPEKENFGWR